jgi:hypothetical protein
MATQTASNSRRPAATPVATASPPPTHSPPPSVSLSIRPGAGDAFVEIFALDNDREIATTVSGFRAVAYIAGSPFQLTGLRGLDGGTVSVGVAHGVQDGAAIVQFSFVNTNDFSVAFGIAIAADLTVGNDTFPFAYRPTVSTGSAAVIGSQGYSFLYRWPAPTWHGEAYPGLGLVADPRPQIAGGDWDWRDLIDVDIGMKLNASTVVPANQQVSIQMVVSAEFRTGDFAFAPDGLGARQKYDRPVRISGKLAGSWGHTMVVGVIIDGWNRRDVFSGVMDDATMEVVTSVDIWAQPGATVSVQFWVLDFTDFQEKVYPEVWKIEMVLEEPSPEQTSVPSVPWDPQTSATSVPSVPGGPQSPEQTSVPRDPESPAKTAAAVPATATAGRSPEVATPEEFTARWSTPHFRVRKIFRCFYAIPLLSA